MNRRIFMASGAVTFAAVAASARAMTPRPSLREKLATRAESSNYTQTSSLKDVVAFLNALDQRGAPIARGSLGRTHGGFDIPYVVASRPMVRTPAEARALNRPIVYLQATTHGGEVEGKEALLSILRDLCLATDKTLLEDLVLLVVPVYNPDGNEALGPQARNRPDQNGPERVGTRENGSGIDLATDYVRVAAPETRGAFEFLRAWQPDVFIDLRCDGGSFHNFGVTYAPSLHPAAYYGGAFARDGVLPAVRKELHEKFGVDTFPCGGFGRTRALLAPPAPSDPDYAWFPCDYRPRYATNYMGVRGRVSLLVNAYAHDPFERRVYTTRAFVESALGYCSDNDDRILGNSRTASHWIGGMVPIRAGLPARASARETIEYENLAVSSERREPGLPAGYQRTGTFARAEMPVFDRYVGSLYVKEPVAYLVPYEYAKPLAPLLQTHGIAHRALVSAERFDVQDFLVERIDRGGVSGRWRQRRSFATKFGALYVVGGQPVGTLLSVLLEPQSDDGFFGVGVFDPFVRPGAIAPVLRVV